MLRIEDLWLSAPSRRAGRGQWASCGLLLLRLLGSAVPSAGYLAGSTAFPQGSFGRERPPFGGGAALLTQRHPAPEPGPQTGGSLPSTSQRPGSARQVHRLTCNRSEVSRIEISCHVTEKAFVGAHTLRCRCARPVRARNLLIHAQNSHPAMRVDPQVAKPWWRAAASKKRRLSRGGGSSKAKEPPQGALMTRHDDAIAFGIVKTKINKVLAIG